MRIAAFGDVHGNFPSLEAVLADITATSPDQIWCHGDISFGGPWPRQCAEAVRASATVVTMGNTEEFLGSEARPDAPPPWGLNSDEDKEREIVKVAQRDWNAIGPDLRAWLASLPHEHELPALDRVVLTHATRRSIMDLIPELDAADSEWLEAYGPPPAIVVCGHNHKAFVKEVDPGLTVVNTGSVGAPMDGDPRASWLLMVEDEGGWTFDHRRVNYDRESAAATFEALGPHGARFGRAIRTGV